MKQVLNGREVLGSTDWRWRYVGDEQRAAFASSRNAVVPTNRFRHAMVRGSDSEAGRWLHTYADTWAHEGFSAWPSPALNSRGGGPFPFKYTYIGHVDTPEGGHFPDNPYNDVPKAMESASRILDLMRGLRSAGDCGCTKGPSLGWGLYFMFSYYNSDEDARIEYNKHWIHAVFGEWPQPPYDQPIQDDFIIN